MSSQGLRETANSPTSSYVSTSKPSRLLLVSVTAGLLLAVGGLAVYVMQPAFQATYGGSDFYRVNSSQSNVPASPTAEQLTLLAQALKDSVSQLKQQQQLQQAGSGDTSKQIGELIKELRGGVSQVQQQQQRLQGEMQQLQKQQNQQKRAAPSGPYVDALRAFKAYLLQTYLGTFKEQFKKEDWQKFLPVIRCPESRPLTKYGQGDGSKLLCKVEDLPSKLDGSPCIIYSLGSNGDFQFEQAMLTATKCNVHTFDCTYNGSSIDGGKRHQYHKWCIGKKGDDWKTWPQINAALNHSSVDLLKMDIEGHEYPVLAGFQATDALPMEISLEFHVTMPGTPNTNAELALVFLHMANLGYVTYAQEVNQIAPHCCSEFTFMRVVNSTDGRK